MIQLAGEEFAQAGGLVIDEVPAARQSKTRAGAQQVLAQIRQGCSPVAQRFPGAALQGDLQVIEALREVVEPAARMETLQARGGGEEFFAAICETKKEKLAQATCRAFDEFDTGENVLGDDFRGGAGSGRADVGDEITDSEVDFVADGGDNGNGRFEDGARDGFFVERPEIFQAAAAAGQKD